MVTELTVDENLRLGGLWRTRPGRRDGRALDEVYELFEPLARRRRHPGHQLSGGERQMLALGRALVGAAAAAAARRAVARAWRRR